MSDDITSWYTQNKHDHIYICQVFSDDTQLFHKEYVLKSLKLSDKYLVIFKNLKGLGFTVIKIWQFLNVLFGMKYPTICEV